MSWPRRLLAAHSAAVVVFLWAPIVLLVVYSFNRSERTAAWGGATLAWYGEAFRDARLLRAAGTSLWVALLSTLLATLLGTLVALALARYRLWGRAATQAMLVLPIVTPEIVVGAALLTVFAVVRLRLGLTTVVLAHLSFSLSYVALVVRARLAGLDRALEEAAADLGAGPMAAFRRVTLPQLAPGILAGALLAFTLSIDDYVITSFVAGVGATTLPLQIYSMLKVGVTPEVNAVSTLLLVVTVAAILFAQRLLGGQGRGS